jgi:beta-lactamase regulating signal transducer with metallopeptidase domain
MGFSTTYASRAGLLSQIGTPPSLRFVQAQVTSKGDFMSTWLVILMLWIAPAVALLVVLVRTLMRRADRQADSETSDPADTVERVR